MYDISMNPVRAAVSSGANASPDFQDDTDDQERCPRARPWETPTWAPRLRPPIRTTTH